MIGIELYVLGVLGVIVHVLKKMYESRKKQVKLDIILEVISATISLIITSTLIYSKESLEGIYPITTLTAFLLGYSAQSVFRTIANTVSPNTNKIGGELPDEDDEEGGA